MADNELTEAVAKEIMGWVLTKSPPGTMWRNHIGGPGLYYGEDRGAGGNAWNPITNANHWMMVIEKLQSMGYKVEIRSIKQNIGREVCLAALEAVRHRAQTATNVENIPDITVV